MPMNIRYIHKRNCLNAWQNFSNRDFNTSLRWVTLFPFCLWYICLTKNNNVFNSKRDINFYSHVIGQATKYHHIIALHHTITQTFSINVRWEPPDRGVFKLNIDEAVKTNPGLGGLGGLFRDNEGNWVLGYQEHIPHTTPIEAELKALRKGLQLAIRHNLSPLEINTDTHKVVNEKLEIKELQHVFREQNKTADLLPKNGLKEESASLLLFAAPPTFVANQLEAYARGVSYARILNSTGAISPGRDVAYISISSPSVNREAPSLLLANSF